MTTGEKIKELRKKQNMSQEQLGDVLGLSRQAVSRWETENAIPETTIILKLSELFHVTTDYLLKKEIPGGAAAPEKLPETQRKKSNANLILGICGMGAAITAASAILLITAANPMMRDGTYGILDPNFWEWNGLVPLAIIIVTALCVGVYYLGKYYFNDWQPK